MSEDWTLYVKVGVKERKSKIVIVYLSSAFSWSALFPETVDPNHLFRHPLIKAKKTPRLSNFGYHWFSRLDADLQATSKWTVLSTHFRDSGQSPFSCVEIQWHVFVCHREETIKSTPRVDWMTLTVFLGRTKISVGREVTFLLTTLFVVLPMKPVWATHPVGSPFTLAFCLCCTSTIWRQKGICVLLFLVTPQVHAFCLFFI